MKSLQPIQSYALDEDSPIRLSSSPYTYVRTRVMNSQLFEKRDYDKMLKMELAEIIQFLEESVYRREIDELAMSESGVQLVEHAVNRNFRRAVEKLRRISDPQLRLLIDAYLWRNDVQNIKTLLRAKQSGEKKERFANMITPGSMAKEVLLSLFNKDKIEDIISSLNMPFTKNVLKIYREGGLAAFESEITKQYYNQTLALAHRIKGEGTQFQEFLLLEIEVINILTILKLKHEGATQSHIASHLIRDAQAAEIYGEIRTSARNRLIQNLLSKKTVSEAFAILLKTRIGATLEAAAAEYDRTHSLLAAERELHRYLLRRSILLTHQNPLSVDVILGFLFAKVQENRNIFMLIKGKQLAVSNSFLEKELVIV